MSRRARRRRRCRSCWIVSASAVHECWTVVEAGLGGADDDGVSIYADDRGAILITHDAEATKRRRTFTYGRHVFLRCHQLEAVELSEQHIGELEKDLEQHRMGVVEVRESEVTDHPPRYETD